MRLTINISFKSSSGSGDSLSFICSRLFGLFEDDGFDCDNLGLVSVSFSNACVISPYESKRDE